MRTPSGRMFPSTVNIYSLPAWSAATSTLQANQDVEGGFLAAYANIPSLANALCNIQYVDDIEETDEIGRVTEFRRYRFFFPASPNVNVRDKLVWFDSSGKTRTAYVRASKDMGFFGVVFRVEAVERI